MALAHILGAYQDRFLAEYWQKKPLLLRGAFPGGLHAVDPEELAGLACDPGVEARLVLEKGQKPWETRHGPFSEEDFTSLPTSHWSLLVQAVDRLLPEVSALRQHFRFLPNWRVDDVMISYAPDQGSVGPHIDNYDVFLIQGQGRRRWSIESQVRTQAELVPDLDMKILAHFEPDQTWVLEPGDMLYLPPGIPHHGVALGSSLTYSMGFRAPQQRELLAGFCQYLLETHEEALEGFYADPGLSPRAEPGAITGEEVERLWQLLSRSWADPELFKRWVGSFITEPRSFHEAPARELSAGALEQKLGRGLAVRRSEGARAAYLSEPGQDKVFFYVEGQTLELSQGAEKLCAYLCREELYETKELLTLMGPLQQAGIQLLTYLWNQGFLRCQD